MDDSDGTIRHHTVAHSDPADADQAGQALLLQQLTPTILGRIAQGADHLELLTALNLGSVMIVPLAGRTRILGSITFASHQPGRYAQADLTLAQNLARRTATAIGHADRVHHPNPPRQPRSRTHRELGIHAAGARQVPDCQVFCEFPPRSTSITVARSQARTSVSRTATGGACKLAW